MFIHDCTVADAVAADPADYAERCLDRYDVTEPSIRAFVTESDRDARVRATVRERARDSQENQGPLHGVPVGVKDIFHADGFETRAGSDVPPDALAGPEASVVTALRDAGAYVFGKTVTAEFAYFEPGPTRNPHDIDRTPGGSSSGSAAAVAAGVVPLALGTQTIGSIIRPASYCGVVGVKPSFDRIPADGLVSFSPSADHIGYFTQAVEDARTAAPTLYESWNSQPEPPTDRPVLGLPSDAYLSQASEGMLTAFEQRVERLHAAGYDVVQTDALADIEAINARHRELTAAEAALEHARLHTDYGDRYAAATSDILRDGRDSTVGRVVAARNGRRELRRSLAATSEERGIDIWLSPAATDTPPAGIETTGDPVMNLPWTHAGIPTVSVPAGTLDGLPVGVQVAGQFGDDERLLTWSEQLQSVVGSA